MRLAVCLVCTWGAHAAHAQDSTATAVALSEAVVSTALAPVGTLDIPVAGALARDPATLADVARLIPSAVAPTNSRGETLLAIRGAGERQTAVTLDGAPLTVPWDRRLDLALVPAGAIGRLDVTRGPASLVVGPNATGGALDLSPRALQQDGTLTSAEASTGLPARARLAATALHRRGARSLGASVDAQGRDGAALASPLPFSQVNALRTNTDRRSLSALVRAAYVPDAETSASLTVLHLDAAQGVAPEGHLNPDSARVRFWRIPVWRQTTLVARARTGRALRLDASAWAGRFAQTIDQFASVRYDARDGGEADRDATEGARLVVERGRRVVIRGIGWAQQSRHRQRDSLPRTRSGDGSAEARFRELQARGALETEARVGAASVLVGVGLDVFRPTEAAGRDVGDAFRLVGGVVRAQAPVGAVRVHAGVSRGGRFPTMRELFGDALGRFALNPDLRPETTWQAEAGVRARLGAAQVRAALFARHTEDTIEQAALPDGRRQRVNLGSSRALGAEADAALRRGALRLDAGASLLYLRGRVGGATVRLPERPAALARLGVSVLPARGWNATAEALATGPAVSLGPDGLLDLPAALTVGARVGYGWALAGGRLDAFVRIDNAFDATLFPQAGLPAPGREARIGLTWGGLARR